jgi:hypothetical protein
MSKMLPTQHLCALAMPVPVNRMFSNTACIITKRRNALKQEKMKLIFLEWNFV